MELRDIIRVKVLSGYRLRLKFDDGVEGIVDISEYIPFKGVFRQLKDVEYFRQVKVNPESGTIVWPNGADLDSDVLYAQVTGKAIEIEEVKTAVTEH
jgi:hypothetical protein